MESGLKATNHWTQLKVVQPKRHWVMDEKQAIAMVWCAVVWGISNFVDVLEMDIE